MATRGKGGISLKKFAVVGERLPNVDWQKVSGQAKYCNDLSFPNMLWGKVLRSPHPHALIRSIDTSEAQKLPGVEAVITAKDTLGIKYIVMGPPFEDKYPLAVDKVRYVGDEIAAVAAINEEVAQLALDLIKVEYELLPAVFDPEEAVKENAPVIHDHVSNNIAAKAERNYGNVEKGFAESDYIFEDRFVCQAQSHTCIEPRSCLSFFDADGCLNMWSSTQSPYFIRKELAHILSMPISKVKIHRVFVGGGFGARSKICEDEAISALLAQKTGKPVKITLTREEEMATTRIRHPMVIYLKTGVKKDGTFVARYMKIITENGAYNHTGPAITGFAAMIAASLYRVKEVKVDTQTVYTNKHVGGPFRGYGNPQVTFAIESQLDLIANKLGIDPVDIRIHNANRPGDVTPCGWVIKSCGLAECLEKARDEIGWREKRAANTPGVGLGIASLIHCSGAYVYADGDFSAAFVKVYHDGQVEVSCGSADIGTWSNTTLSQIAAEVLGVPLKDVTMLSMDTESTPVDMGSWGSRTIFTAGNAVLKAAKDSKEQILEGAAKLLKCEASLLNIREVEGVVSVVDPKGSSVSLGEAVLASSSRIGQSVYGRGHYEPDTELINRQFGTGNIAAAYTFAAQAVELSVEQDTGKVKLLNLVGAHDVGQAINPIAVEGQIEGGIVQGVGYGLMEKHKYDNGRVVTASLMDYKIPTAMDIPHIVPIMVDSEDKEGPFGAKGVGEPGLVPVAPALANAVYNATGVLVKNLPLNPENVFFAITEGKGVSE